jgi:hypothetical protein
VEIAGMMLGREKMRSTTQEDHAMEHLTAWMKQPQIRGD